MKTYIRRWLSLAVLLALMLPVLVVANAQWTIIDFHYAEANDPAGLCGRHIDGSLPMSINILINAVVPETYDIYITVYRTILEDGNGNIIGYGHIWPIPTGLTQLTTNLAVGTDTTVVYAEPASRPWKLTVYQVRNLHPEPEPIPEHALTGQPLLPVFIFDPATLAPSCASLPYVENLEPVSINETGELETQVFIAQDDDGNPALHIYEVNDAGQGEFSLAITQDMLAPFVGNPPASNTQIATSASGKVTLYVLDTGEFQINTGPDENGNVYVTIFDAIPPTNTYGYSFNVYDILGND